MTRAALRGRELRQELGLRGQVDVEAVAATLGLTVVEFCLPNIEEFIADGMVAIADHLRWDSSRWALGHAIGHHVLYGGNVLWLRERTRLTVPYEREADDFSWGLLVDPWEAGNQLATEVLEMTDWDVAEHFGVPQDMVKARLGR